MDTLKDALYYILVSLDKDVLHLFLLMITEWHSRIWLHEDWELLRVPFVQRASLEDIPSSMMRLLLGNRVQSWDLLHYRWATFSVIRMRLA